MQGKAGGPHPLPALCDLPTAEVIYQNWAIRLLKGFGILIVKKGWSYSGEEDLSV